MNAIHEVWSAPWHALQHALAQRLGFEQPTETSREPGLTTARVVVVGPATWLLRTRRLVVPTTSPAPT